MPDSSTDSVDEHQKLPVPLRRHWPLAAIIALYVVLGIWYMWIIPPFEGPDEPQHFAYAVWLADGLGLPPLGDAAFETDIQHEAGQPPLYYLLASIPARIIDTSNPEAEYRPNPYFPAPLAREVPDNDNRAINDASESRPLAGGWLALYSMRSLSLFFGVLLMIATYGLAGQVMPSNPAIAWGAALLVALTPQVLFISTVVSNDIPAAAASAWAIWLLACLIRQGPRPFLAVGIGLAAGLAILFKVSALALVVPIAAGLLWLWYSKRITTRSALSTGGTILVVVTLLTGWWFIRNASLSESPFGTGTHDLTTWAFSSPDQISGFFTRWQEVFQSFWIAIGWGSIRPDGWVYWLLFALTIGSLAGLVLFFIRQWRQSRLASVTVALAAILVLFILAVAVILEIWMNRVLAPHGRLMFPVLSAIAVLMLIGWHQLHRRIPLAAFAVLAILTISTPLLLIKPAFSAPEFLSAEEIEELSPTMGWHLGTSASEPFAELLDVTPKNGSLVAGDVLPVEVCWSPVARTELSYAVLLQLVGPENKVVAHRQSYPGQGFYPTENWTPDRVFCDTMHILVGDDLAETLVYGLDIALIEESTGERLSVFDGDDNLIEAPTVDRVRLVTVEQSKVGRAGIAESGGAIELVKSELQSIWTLGEMENMVLSWVANRSVDQDYQVFVHLRDPRSGETIAQADGPPLDGWYPTSWWPVGEIVVDRRSFQVPLSVQPGTYDLVAGLYDLGSLQVLSGEFLVGTVVIED